MTYFSRNLKAMPEVNLDALIPREDLEIKSLKNIGQNVPSININALKKGEFFFENLRKPDFQRETCEWTPNRVYNLVSSFVNGDLIPSIILWKGEGYTFVIDGAHRLSALIAWVMNDYGDKGISKSFFGEIDDEQIQLAEQTRRLIEKNIGSFEDIIWANQNQDKADPTRVAIAQRLGALPIYLQWVPGDANNAEKSFFRINESASPIDKTEKRLLKSRNKPSGIAARAISRAGTGHKYWSKFPENNQDKIESISKEINKWLFTPKLKTPVKTLDIALAGKNHSEQTLELILNVVNFSNGLSIVDKSNVKKDEDYPEYNIPDEINKGQDTIEYLSNAKKMLANITGVQSSSLGLHPVIYFYSKQGRYQVTSFMAVVQLITSYERGKRLKSFTRVRKKFEEFLWKHKNIVNQAQTEWGSGAKGYIDLSSLFDFIVQSFIGRKSEEQILQLLDKHEKFGFYKPLVKDHNPIKSKNFSTETKSEIYLRDAISSALRCDICGGFVHVNSIQIDHKNTKADGGIGIPENGTVTHPYCNSIKKDLIAEGFSKPEKE
jgi:Protein of unknown function DUF262/HNH endonuclease